MNELYLNIYDVRTKIFSNDKNFITLAEENFFSFRQNQTDKFDLEVKFIYGDRYWEQAKEHFLSSAELVGSTGSIVYLNKTAVYLADFIVPGLLIIVSKRDGRYYVEAFLKEPKRKICFSRHARDWENLSKTLRLIVVYPLFSLLRETNNLDFLHASAIEIAGQGFAFVGLPGAGKTRCLMQLLNHQEVNFLADNYILLNSKGNLFAFPEIVKIRQDGQDEKESLKNNQFIKRLPFKHTGKNYFLIDSQKIKSNVPLNKIFFLKRANKTRISRIDSERFACCLDALEKFTKDFYELSYLGLLSLTEVGALALFKGRLERLRNILYHVECYEMLIKEGEEDFSLIIEALKIKQDR